MDVGAHTHLPDVAFVLLTTFVLIEVRSKNPILPIRVVAERSRGGSFLASFLLGAGLFAMFVFLSYYMQSVLHYSALKAGVAFLPFAVGVIVAATASSAIVRVARAAGPEESSGLSSAVGWVGSPRSV